MTKTLVVIGGGAAGFFCAINAARQNPLLTVIILEKQNKLLGKVKVSGGGRCNVTHKCYEIAELVKSYPRGQQFLKKAFHWFNANHTISWFAERGIELHIEPDGRMFPTSNSSQTIIDCFTAEAAKYGVQIKQSTEVVEVLPFNQQWTVTTKNNTITADYICIAAGGYATVDKFSWLQKLGHSIAPPVPSLFTFNLPKNPITELMGLAVTKVSVKIAGTKWQSNGPLLVTHWGLSGPAILKLSAWAARDLANTQYKFRALINWLGDISENQLREKWLVLRQSIPSQKLTSRNPFGLPTRLWQFLLDTAEVTEKVRWGELTTVTQNKLIQLLTAHAFDVNGKTTFKEEFVTCGGIQLQEVDPNTMESKKQPNLYFAGEILDIDGITGGYNFQNAWTTGWIAAKSISDKIKQQSME